MPRYLQPWEVKKGIGQERRHPGMELVLVAANYSKSCSWWWVFICGGVLVVVLSLHVGVVLVLLLGVFQFASIWHSNRQFRYEYAMSLKCPTESKRKHGQKRLWQDDINDDIEFQVSLVIIHPQVCSRKSSMVNMFHLSTFSPKF